MNQTHSFRAPWGTSLKIISSIATLLLVGMPAFIIIAKAPALLAVGIPLVILFAALPFTIRGYELSNGTLYVRRLFWRNSIPLQTLREIEIKPNAMAGSIRTFGNGGLFSFSGWYKSSKLGSYRAFATDPKNTVVLFFSDRTIVVTPDRANEFVDIVKNMTTL